MAHRTRRCRISWCYRAASPAASARTAQVARAALRALLVPHPVVRVLLLGTLALQEEPTLPWARVPELARDRLLGAGAWALPPLALPFRLGRDGRWADASPAPRAPDSLGGRRLR